MSDHSPPISKIEDLKMKKNGLRFPPLGFVLGGAMFMSSVAMEPRWQEWKDFVEFCLKADGAVAAKDDDRLELERRRGEKKREWEVSFLVACREEDSGKIEKLLTDGELTADMRAYICDLAAKGRIPQKVQHVIDEQYSVQVYKLDPEIEYLPSWLKEKRDWLEKFEKASEVIDDSEEPRSNRKTFLSRSAGSVKKDFFVT